MADFKIAGVLGLDTSAYEAQLKRATKALRPLQQRLEQVGSTLTRSLTLPLVALGGAAVTASASMGRLSAALTSAMGSAEAASVEMERLRQAAQAPGLGFEQAVRGSVRLQAVGLSADQAREALVQFGNAIALAGGTAEDLDGVALALTQIASKGKVSAEEINQIAERVPQVRVAMQQAFGTAASEEIQKLGITAEAFITGLVEQLSTLERAQGSLSNALSNLGMSGRGALTALGDLIAEELNLQRVAEALSGVLDRVAEVLRGMSPEMRRLVVVLGVTAAAIGPILTAMGTLAGLLPVISAGFAALGITIKGALITSGIGAALVALGTVAWIIYDNWEEVRLRLEVTWAKIRGAAAVLLSGMLEAVRSMSALVPGLGVAIDTLQAGMQRFGQQAVADLARATGALAAFKAGARDAADPLRQATEASGMSFSRGGAAEPVRERRRVRFKLFDEEEELRLRRLRVGVGELAGAMRVELAPATQVTLDTMRGALDGISLAIGDVIAGFDDLGSAVSRVVRSILADLAAMLARTLILRGLLSLFGGATGGIAGLIGSAVRSLAGPSLQVAPTAGAAPILTGGPVVLVAEDGMLIGALRRAETRLTQAGRG